MVDKLYAGEKKGRSGVALAVIVIILIGGWLFFLNGTTTVSNALDQVIKPFQPSQQEVMDKTASFSSLHGNDFITYHEKEHGFSINYPIGYEANENPSVGVSVGFYAYYPNVPAEVIEVSVLEGDFSKNDFSQATQGMKDVATLTKSWSHNIEGKDIYLLEGSENQNGVSGISKVGFITCSTQNNTAYTVIVNSFIPSQLSADSDTVDYMIYSLQC